MTKQYYLFGLQRSGTNFLEALIKINYGFLNLNDLNETWKHLIIPPKLKNQSKIILIHKNPYTWIESICLRNSVDWCKRQINYPLDEKDPKLKLGNRGYSIVSLAKAWNDFHLNWLNYKNFNNHNFIIVKYESLINGNISSVIKNIETSFSWENEKKIIVPSNISQSKKFNSESVDYYTRQLPLELNKNQINFINDCISDDLFKFFDYEKL